MRLKHLILKSPQHGSSLILKSEITPPESIRPHSMRERSPWTHRSIVTKPSEMTRFYPLIPRILEKQGLTPSTSRQVQDINNENHHIPPVYQQLLPDNPQGAAFLFGPRLLEALEEPLEQLTNQYDLTAETAIEELRRLLAIKTYTADRHATKISPTPLSKEVSLIQFVSATTGWKFKLISRVAYSGSTLACNHT